MKNNPLVSVIIPSYNHEKYVEEAILSVWNQTYKNIELIVIDDGSRDGSVKIIQRLEARSPIPMKVRVKVNEGVCKTLNLGLQECRGKYIAVLASDDRYISSKFELLVPIIEMLDESVSFIYSSNVVINEDGSRMISNSIYSSNSCNEVNYVDNLFEKILLFKQFPTLSSTVIKKDILFQVGQFNEKYKFEDLDVMLRLTREHKAVFYDYPTFEYRGNLVGSLGKNISMLYKDVIGIFEDNIKHSKKIKSVLWRNYAYGRLFTRIAESFYMSNDFKQSRFWSVKSLIVNPFQYKAYRLFFPSLFGQKIINWLREGLHISRRRES